MRGPKKSEVAPQIRTGVLGYGLVLDCLECAMECKEVGFDLARGIHSSALAAPIILGRFTAAISIEQPSKNYHRILWTAAIRRLIVYVSISPMKIFPIHPKLTDHIAPHQNER